jgi:hypothetical protein
MNQEEWIKQQLDRAPQIPTEQLADALAAFGIRIKVPERQ